MNQLTQVLVQAGPHQCVIPSLLSYIADRNGFPFVQQILATADEQAAAADWTDVQQYSESINPYVSMHTGYVPIQRQQQPTKAPQLALY